MGLRSFVDKETIDDMKLLGKPSCLFGSNFIINDSTHPGLLTADIRVRERKWYGRVKARKAYTWKRR